MSAWRIQLRREQVAFITVEADNAEQAKDRALEKAEDLDWDDSPEFHIVDIDSD